MGGQPHAPAASTPGKDPVPILQEAGWAPGPAWTGGKSRPHRDSIPDRPALYLLRVVYNLSTTTRFGLYIGHHQVVPFLVIGLTIQNCIVLYIVWLTL